MLCSTAIAAVLVMPHTGNAGDAPKPGAALTKTRQAKSPIAGNPWALPNPISPDVIRTLTDAQWSGPNGLVAGVFDQVRARPAMRDAVVNYAQGLAPTLKRDLATAGDLAVLTANEKLVLAPNSGAVLNSLRASNAGSTINMANAFANSPASVGPQAAPVPVPPVYTQSWNRDMIGVQIANARGANYTGSGVTVAVGDTGFDVNNDALKNRLNLTLAKNYVVNTSGTAYDPTFVGLQSTTDNHGSHVAGIIAAEPVAGVDMRGVAYNARIIPVRVVLGGDEAPDAT
jgi:subtilase-type serine protease